MTQAKASVDGGLIRAVGAFGLAAAIANIMVGGGIYRLPANVATSLGAAAPIAYIVCAVVMGLIGLCIAEAGSRVAMTGGPYAYVEVAFGPFMGYMTGVMTWMLGITAFAAVANVFIESLGAVVPMFATSSGRTLGLIGAFAFLGSVNIIGVQHGNRLNTTMIIVKVIPLLILVVLGFAAIEPANLAVVEMPAASNIARTSIVLLFAFTGVESALVVGGELKDPARTVPRGIFLGMVGVTLLYLSIQLVAQGVLGDALAGSTTPLADAAGAALGPWGRQLLLLGVIVSTFGYLSGMSLASPRSLFAFARDGFLPRPLAAVHPKFHTPWVAVLVQLALACGIAITSSFGSLAVISNVAALLCYFACAVAAWRLRRDGVQEPGSTPFRAPGGAVTPILACLAIVALLTSITAQEWLVLVQLTAGATVIFFATRKHRRIRLTPLATLVFVPALLAAQPAARPTATSPSLAGRFVRDAQASDDVRAAIERAVAPMNFVTRPVGRSRLRTTNQPPADVRFALPTDSIVVHYAGQPELRARRDGAPREWRNADGEPFTARVTLQTGESGLVVWQAFEAEDGRRENTWTLDAAGSTLTLDVQVSSPRLPQPLRYRQVFRRAP